jgi:phosphoglucosamine mutase
MAKLFGTDGIRGIANTHPLTPEMAVQVGLAVAAECRRDDAGRPALVIGRDTRRSGSMLEGALAAGICSAGSDVHLAGVVPTPAVAHLVTATGAGGGVVVSASHNPHEDNGIKLFGPDGRKFSSDTETRIENQVASGEGRQLPQRPRGAAIGTAVRLADGAARYAAMVKKALSPGIGFDGLRLAVDCANGATSGIAQRLLTELGAEVSVLNASPDGTNINAGCGSEHPQQLAAWVRRHRFDLGLAFDGDGDRLVAVDADGQVLTGDQVLAILAHYLHESGRLGSQHVVSTVMSNMGLTQALTRMGLRHDTTRVGDRHVAARMRAIGAQLGGENSGHILLADHHTTGDGLLSAVKLLEAVVASGRSLGELSGVMTVYPQVLDAVTVSAKPDLATLPDVQAAIRAGEAQLSGKGRVLVRYSGTQPVCRVMVEASAMDIAREVCETISGVIAKTIGAGLHADR